MASAPPPARDYDAPVVLVGERRKGCVYTVRCGWCGYVGLPHHDVDQASAERDEHRCGVPPRDPAPDPVDEQLLLFPSG